MPGGRGWNLVTGWGNGAWALSLASECFLQAQHEPHKPPTAPWEGHGGRMARTGLMGTSEIFSILSFLSPQFSNMCLDSFQNLAWQHMTISLAYFINLVCNLLKQSIVNMCSLVPSAAVRGGDTSPLARSLGMAFAFALNAWISLHYFSRRCALVWKP